MPFSDEITDRQLALLSDLAALEDAGMIDKSNETYVEEDYNGSSIVEVPVGVTAKGQALLAKFRRSGATIFP